MSSVGIPLPAFQKVQPCTSVQSLFHDFLKEVPKISLSDWFPDLYNQGQFQQQLQQVCTRKYWSAEHSFAVLLLTLDRFRVIRSSLGNDLANHLLVAFSHRLCTLLDSTMLSAHLEGYEFTILLKNTLSLEAAISLAQQIHNALRSPFKISGLEICLTASIGITTSEISKAQPSCLLDDAGLAASVAGAKGGDRSIIFDPCIREKTMKQLQLQSDLRLGILRHEFFLHYQPIIALESLQISGFEALVRWQHPSRGVVSPAEFIPVAEEIGSIVPLGWWILQEACRQMKAWQQQFPNSNPLIMNVNLSSQQFSQPDFIEQLDEILSTTGLEGKYLKLEITETVLMENTDSAAMVLEQLKARNVRVSMDDFGTGYSSLSYLQRFAVSTLKIDRSFIARLETDTKSAGILQAIMMLAQQLGMDVVAEGIERAEQFWQLKALQCQHGQGYLFSQPLTAKAATSLLASPP
jgi:diguanylate cyclase (GGDEF)-like protein